MSDTELATSTAGTERAFRRLARKVGWQLFWRDSAAMAVLASCVVVPVVLACFLQRFLLLLLSPACFLLFRARGWSWSEAVVLPTCPGCGQPVSRQIVENGPHREAFIACERCGFRAATGYREGDAAGEA